MNEWYDRQAKINANRFYRETLQFMTLGEIKKLHRDNGISDNIKLDQCGIISALKILGEWG